MRATFVLIYLLIGFCSLKSQGYCDFKYDYVWIMGGYDDTIVDQHGGSELNFNFNPVGIYLHPKNVMSPLQNAVVSSNQGELLFYSNGCDVLNVLNEVMEFGDTLNPGEVHNVWCPIYGYSGFQNMIILPSSYDSFVYFIFHIDKVYNHEPDPHFLVQSERLYMTTVDMSYNNGLGRVTAKNKIILQDTSMLGSPMTAVKHANGRDWWLITPDRWSNGFYISLVDELGAHEPEKQFIGFNTHPLATGGQGKFSPDGSTFAWYHPKNSLFLYKFDREIGMLSDFSKIEIPEVDFITGGLEFSPTGHFLYVNQDTSLFQIDMLDQDMQGSLTHIADYDGFGAPLPTFFYKMERTPDKRIIMNVLNGSQYLHVIQEPEKKGIACRFEQHAIMLPTVNNFTLPHFPNYRLGALGEPLCDSLMVSSKDPYSISSDNFKIIPNPASDYIQLQQIEGNSSGTVSTCVFDIFGHQVLSSNHLSIDISHLPAGIYFLRITDKDKFVQQSKLLIAGK